MPAGRVVPRGAFYIGLQGAFTYLIYFLSFVVLARILTPTEIGKIPLLNTVQAVFSTITLLSLNMATTKFVSEYAGTERTDKVFGVTATALKLVGALAIPGFLTLTLLSPRLSELIFGTSADSPILSLVVLFGLVTDFGAILVSVLWGLNLFGEMVTANLAGVISGRVVGILLATSNLRLEGYLIGWVVGAVTTLALSLAYSRRYLKRSEENASATMMLAFSYPILFTALIALVQNWADVTILYAVTGSLVFTAAYYLGLAGSNILSPVTIALTNAIFPTLSSRHGRGEADSFRTALRIAERAVNVLVMPISFGLAAIAGTAVTVAYGKTYLGATVPFAVLIGTSIIGAYQALMGFVLQATGRTQPLIKISSAAALTEVILTPVLVVPLGLAGPAAARVGMGMVSLLLTYKYVKGEWWPALDRGSLGKSIALSIMVASLLFAFDSVIGGLLIGSLSRLLLDGAGFLIIYLAGLIVLKPLHPEDIALLQEGLPTGLHGLLRRIAPWLTKPGLAD